MVSVEFIRLIKAVSILCSKTCQAYLCVSVQKKMIHFSFSGWEEQFPTAAKSGIQRGSDRTEKSSSLHRL